MRVSVRSDPNGHRQSAQAAATDRKWFGTAQGALGTIASSLILGCAAPNVDIRDCEAQCPDEVCPSDMTCSHGYCVHVDSNVVCGASGMGSTGGASSAAKFAEGGKPVLGDTSVTGTASGGAVATGGASVAGGSALGSAGVSVATASEAGAGGTGAGMGGDVTVAGDSGSNGGIAGSGFAGMVAIGGGGAGGSACGMGGLAGVGGWAGAKGQFCELRIENQTLNAGCLGEQYRAVLTADGGCSLEWSTTTPPPGLALSTDGILSGELTNTGNFSMAVTVRDRATGCESTKNVSLLVNGDSVSTCPTIRLRDRPVGALAPPSCATWPYHAEFVVSGGQAPYTWAAQTTPLGLVFDPITQTLAGTATDGGLLTLRIKDGDGRVVQRRFDVPLREKCWLGYVTSGSGPSRLRLYDPYLDVQLERPAASTSDQLVTDFQFSPTGKFVAYRVKDAGGNSKLWLWQAPDFLHEQALELGGSVEHYAWSNDGQVLAVAVTSSAGTFLTGVTVTDVGTPPNVAGIQGLFSIPAVAASVDSDMTWYGNDGFVAFHSRFNPKYEPRVLSSATFRDSTFSAVGFVDVSLYAPPIVIHPAPDGMFVTQTAGAFLKFYLAQSSDPTFHGAVAVAPSGRLVANANGTLNVYRPLDPSDEPEYLPWSSAPGCGTVLSWAQQRERLACADGANTSVGVYDVDVPNGTIAALTVLDTRDYAAGSWLGRRRLISPSGNWLAMTTSEKLFLARIGGALPSMRWRSVLSNPPTYTDLSFSPDENILLFRDDDIFHVFDVAKGNGVDIYLGASNTIASACQEDTPFLPTWCGTEPQTTNHAWSSESDLLAYVASDGTLVIKDLRRFTQDIPTITVAASCTGPCASAFRFQP